MCVSFVVYTFIYFVLSFYLEELPGNTYILGICFGLAEILSVFIYGALLTQCGDIKLLIYSYFIMIAGIATILYGPESLSFIALMAVICALGGWITLHFYITELRVPPQNLGSVNLIS